MKKGILLFDLDRTIFDTEKMSKTFSTVILNLLGNNDLERFENTKEEYKRTLIKGSDFSPEDFVSFLCKKYNFTDKKCLLEVYYGEKYKHIYEENVFTETYQILEILRYKYFLGIYSEGTEKFQNHKFKSMNITNYFKKDLIFIVDNKDTQEVIELIPKKAIIIDDKENICEFLIKNEIKAIWLNKIDDTKSNNFETIHSLLDLPNVL